ncbi:DEKNAAC104172 [Brettanomyces naardenensis]|uniref:DEKNAAC104172 n=1 Tax=Brettanomyces naardenensis TaxID=13370 RepID=A0A448YPX9_BRENA|nr:DEKNAAC104172 [Brettanomyces naardenensis]
MGLRDRHHKYEESDKVAERDPMEEEDSLSDSASEQQDKTNHRPKVNAFTQQKLKAVHPILTPKNVIPVLIALAVLFVPLGAGMLYGARRVEDLVIDYSQCENLANENYYTDVPSEYFDYNFHKKNTLIPQWKLDTNSSYLWNDYPEDRKICKVQFQVPDDIGPPVFLFYRLRNFHANHRRYATSFSEDQILGKQASVSDIKDTVGQNCQPLSVDSATGKIIYPCGLIANSLFNDTFSTFTAVNGSTDDYALSRDNIAWKYNTGRFKKTTYTPDQIVPPPNWIKMYPDGYNDSNLPDISQWPELQNWMAASALSPFSKLVGRNDNDVLRNGTYEISIGLHFPVLPYNGHKYLYLSTRSVVGGRNPFLGIVWMVGGCICVILAAAFVAIKILHPRKLGDPALLSWNKEEEEVTTKE